ncbi:MAG: hypothetical protein IH621_17550, partial [Krumholzibacteria bacterium]|nr:hypothetical protein [Candidatus Krumholzibacteria bacterium]
HNVRRTIFDLDTFRLWERRSLALDHIGDGLFVLFARDYAPLAERLDAITGRLEAIPAYVAATRSRATAPQVRVWQRLEIEAADHLPTFIDEIVSAGKAALADGTAAAYVCEFGRCQAPTADPDELRRQLLAGREK